MGVLVFGKQKAVGTKSVTCLLVAKLTHPFTDSCDGFLVHSWGGARVPPIQTGLQDWKRRKKESNRKFI